MSRRAAVGKAAAAASTRDAPEGLRAGYSPDRVERGSVAELGDDVRLSVYADRSVERRHGVSRRPGPSRGPSSFRSSVRPGLYRSSRLRP